MRGRSGDRGVAAELAVEGVTLHVEHHGPESGLPVVLLHAFPLSHRMWTPQLEALSDRYFLVAPDVRGHGGSEASDGQYTLELLVDDLLALLDALALDRVVGCGISLGGYLLLRALERAPERFRALVLADTRSAADDDGTKLARAAAVRALKTNGAMQFAEASAERLLGRTTRARRPEVVAAALEIMRGNSVLGMCGVQIAMAGRTDTTRVLGTLQMPTMVVAGEEDVVTPPSVARELARAVPGARLELIPGAGHLSSFEDPGAFNRVLRSFLEQVEAREAQPPHSHSQRGRT